MSDAQGIKKFAGLLMAGMSTLCGIKKQGRQKRKRKKADDVF